MCAWQSQAFGGGSGTGGRTSLTHSGNVGSAVSSAEEFIGDLVPLRHMVLGLLRREEMAAEFALRRTERRHARRHGRMCRQIVSLSEHLLAFPRDDEVD